MQKAFKTGFEPCMHSKQILNNFAVSESFFCTVLAMVLLYTL